MNFFIDESMYQFRRILIEDVSEMSTSDKRVSGYFAPDSNILYHALNLGNSPSLKSGEVRQWLSKTKKTLYQPILDETYNVLNHFYIERRDTIAREHHRNLRNTSMERFYKMLDTNTTRLVLTPRFNRKSPIKHFNSDLSDRLLEEIERGKIGEVDATLLFLAGVAKPKAMVVSYDKGVNEVAFRHDIPCFDTRISRGRLPVDFTDPWDKRIDSPLPG